MAYTGDDEQYGTSDAQIHIPAILQVRCDGEIVKRKRSAHYQTSPFPLSEAGLALTSLWGFSSSGVVEDNLLSCGLRFCSLTVQYSHYELLATIARAVSRGRADGGRHRCGVSAHARKILHSHAV